FSVVLFMAPPPTGIDTLSLHDALPIWVLDADGGRSPAPGLARARPAPRGAPRRGPGVSQADLSIPFRRRAGRAMEDAFLQEALTDRKSTRLNSSHVSISYAVFCLKKKR